MSQESLPERLNRTSVVDDESGVMFATVMHRFEQASGHTDSLGSLSLAA